jgi:hypothetical protein
VQNALRTSDPAQVSAVASQDNHGRLVIERVRALRRGDRGAARELLSPLFHR